MTISCNGSKGHHVFTLNTSERNPSTEDNDSVVDFSFVLGPIQTSWNWAYWGTRIYCKVNINGNIFDGYIPDYDGYSTVTIKSGSVTVPHNDDGSKSISVSFEVSDSTGQTYTCGNASASGTMKLTDIARATKPSLSASSATLASTQVTINTPRASSSFTHTLRWKIGNTTGIIASSVTTSASWTPPLSLANYITNSTSGTCQIICETYQNGKQIGSSQSVNLTLVIPTSVVPTISSITLAEGDSTMISKNWVIYVQSKSMLKVKITASGSYKSEITSYKITGIDNTSYSSSEFTSNVLQQTGTRTITVVVTDSRGRTATKTTTYTCEPYSNPTISSAEIQRCNSNGELNDDGVYLKYTFKGTITNVKEKNTTHLFQIAYKKTSASSYTYKTLVDGYSINNEGLILSGVTFENTSEYDILFNAVDSFNIPTTITKKLDTASDLLNFNASGKSMAIGKVSSASANEKKLEIAMDTEIEGSLKLNGNEVLTFELVSEWK